MRALDLVAGLLAASLLAGCASPAGGATLHFDLANEAVEGSVEVVLRISHGNDRLEERRRVPYDPVAPTEAFELRWGARAATVEVDVTASGLAAVGSFDLSGQEEWWFYVAVYDDRVRLERFGQPPAFG